jgi:outer membrane protein TolC
MLNKRLSAAKKVATSLFEAEDEIDQAITRTSSLMIKILEARQDAKLPAIIGQEAIEAVGAAVSSLVQSRRDILQAHAGLEVAREQIGVPPQAWGDVFPKPPPSGSEKRESTIRAVI